MKAYKFKLKLSAKVEATFVSWLSILCELYNGALQERRDAYRINHLSVNYHDQRGQLPEIKKEREDFKRVHSQVLQDALKRIEKAFENFFRRVKEKKEKAGFPRFRSHTRYDSFTYPQSGFDLNQKTKKLRLSKIGTMKVHLSRPIEGKIKTCTIKREADGWYVIFAVEEPAKTIEPAPDMTVGIDMGLNAFATLSTGEQIENPRFLRAGEREMKTAQRRVVRRLDKKSRRRKKAVNVLARKHQRVSRQRRDIHFKEANKLVREYRTIKVEDLNIKGMVKNHHLAKSISDAGWGQFISILSFKAEEAGGEVIKVNASNTSTTCSRCKHRHKMPLHIRVYRCSRCHLIIDRDHNAALNIKEQKGRAAPSRMRRVAVSNESSTYQATDLESPTITRLRV